MQHSNPVRQQTTFSINDALLKPTPRQADLIALKDLVKTPDGLLSIFLANNSRAGGGMDLDSYWTCIRLHQVFYNVFLNNAADDKGAIHYEGALGWALVGGGIAASFVGYARAIYQYLHALYIKSDAYYLRKELELSEKRSKLYNDELLDAAIKVRVLNFARRYQYKKLTEADKQAALAKLRFNQKLSALKDNDSLDKFFADEFDDELLSVLVGEDVNLLKSEKAQKQLVEKIRLFIEALKVHHVHTRIDELKKQVTSNGDKKVTDYVALQSNYAHGVAPQPLPVLIQALNAARENRFMDIVRILKDQSGNFSYLYWLFTMPVLIILGVEITAAASAGVIYATIGVGGFFGLWKFGRWALTKLGVIEDKNKGKTPEQLKEEAIADKEDARRTHETKLRRLAVKAHDGVMRIIHGEANWNNLKAVRKADKAAHKQAKVKSAYAFADKVKAVKENEALLRRFLGSKAERRLRLGVSVTSWFSSVASVAFIAFFVAGALGVFGVAAEIVGTIFNPVLVTGLAAGFGLVGSFFDFAKMYTEQAAYEEKVYAVLSAQHKNTNKSNAEVYSDLHASLKAKVEHLRKNDKLTNEQKKVIDDIERTIGTKPHEGLRYFEKFESTASWTSTAKRVWDGIYTFVTKAQTGIFDARFMFLSSGALSSVMVGLAALTSTMIGLTVVSGGATLIPFIITAAILMVVVGVSGVLQTQLDRRQKHREQSIDNLPAEIKTYKKWEQQLVAIDQVNGTKTLQVSNADKSSTVNASAAVSAAPVPHQAASSTGSVVPFSALNNAAANANAAQATNATPQFVPGMALGNT